MLLSIESMPAMLNDRMFVIFLCKETSLLPIFLTLFCVTCVLNQTPVCPSNWESTVNPSHKWHRSTLTTPQYLHLFTSEIIFHLAL
jgi:hypothetical protein